MEVTNEIIQEIAQNLEIGFRCYINKDTGELITLPNEDSYSNFEPTMWQDEIRTIKKLRNKLIEIESMTSADSFRVMEQFIVTVQDEQLQKRLFQSIHTHKPFGHFKLEIDNSGSERERWFEFKRQKFIEWVKDQLIIS